MTSDQLPTKIAPARASRMLSAAEFHQLADVPPEIEWFANLTNPSTRRAYETAVKDFMRFTGIRRPEEFRIVSRAHIIAWRDELAQRGLGGSTVRHRLASLASRFEYLCDKNAVTHNPVKGVERPKTESGEGKTPAIADHQARKLLEAPQADNIRSKRDRAILSTLLFHALRREELCKLKVKDSRHVRKGVPHLKVSGKGGKTRYLPLHPGTIQRHNVEVAITWLVMAKQLVEKDSSLRFAHRGAAVRQLPSVTRGSHRHAHSKPHKARAYPLVKEVIARRVDGRPQHAEPLDAFAEELERLGYPQFRMWWTQIVSELKQSNPSSTPVAVAVLAAALVEGALTFIVKHARASGQFQSKDYEKNPRTWKIDDLVTSAAPGGPAAILDLQTKARAETLIRTRQRIHAGRMLSDYPAGPPDLRPDEARDAKGAADQVVRAVLDWLHKNPPPAI